MLLIDPSVAYFTSRNSNLNKRQIATSNYSKMNKFQTLLQKMTLREPRDEFSSKGTYGQEAKRKNGRVLSIQKPNNLFTTYNTYSGKKTA